MGGQGGDLIHGKGTDMYCALAVCINLHLTVMMHHFLGYSAKQRFQKILALQL